MHAIEDKNILSLKFFLHLHVNILEWFINIEQVKRHINIIAILSYIKIINNKKLLSNAEIFFKKMIR